MRTVNFLSCGMLLPCMRRMCSTLYLKLPSCNNTSNKQLENTAPQVSVPEGCSHPFLGQDLLASIQAHPVICSSFLLFHRAAKSLIDLKPLMPGDHDQRHIDEA